MKNIYDGLLSFNGKWRDYQARVLDEAEDYLSDGKLHIVAAPGAGKTTLGIELIRRVGRPCLILSPRLVIRQQWLERISNSFFNVETDSRIKKELLSNDIRQPGLITSITYQTLHSAVDRTENIEEDEGGGKEEIDFSGFEIIKTVRDAGIGTICLDECHHLKNEWWRSLEIFMKEMKDVTVISLTATPPYDSSPAQWERYTKMCGAVDTEISVPELVREGSLCPHQDYVWFNYPSKEEQEKVRAFRQDADEMFCSLMEDEMLKAAASGHPALADYEGFCDQMLEEPKYLSSLLIYCQAKGIPFSEEWKRVLNISRFPEMSEKWMGILLQGLLYDDRENYPCTEEYRDILLKELKVRGIIEQGKVSFLVNSKIEKLLFNSSGKLDSILKIASCEHTALGEDLRMLILTDYIRKEYRAALGNPVKSLQAIGVLPIFELLRRRGAGWRLGVLCGSLIIIPETAKGAFEEESAQADPQLTPVFRDIFDVEGNRLGYVEVDIKGKLNICTHIITRLFERGYIQILTGTKSLLGEGWDSPCINSLIMASFVGSYVLGNQMRGRAVRTYEKDRHKVSNIWHLVCILPPGEQREKRRMGIPDPELSEDYYTLERRMKGILGVSYDGTVIESGMERLSIIRRPYSAKHISEINEEMARRSSDRRLVAEQWSRAVPLGEKPEVAEEYKADKKKLKPGFGFFYTFGAFLICILAQAAEILRRVWIRGNIHPDNRGAYLIAGVFLLLAIYFGGKLLRILTPMKRFAGIAKGVLCVLKETGCIHSECRVKTEEEEGICFLSWLKGGTDHEKNLYADTLSEVFAPIDNQRYILICGLRKNSVRETYAVPAIFGASKEKAFMFQQALKPYIGRSRLIYTRSPEGRRLLLRARARAFSNKNDRFSDRRKRIKGVLE